MKDEIHLISDEQLNRLAKYLNYQISTIILVVLSAFTFVFIFLAALAAIIFTPYMLYVLNKREKNELDNIFYHSCHSTFNYPIRYRNIISFILYCRSINFNNSILFILFPFTFRSK